MELARRGFGFWMVVVALFFLIALALRVGWAINGPDLERAAIAQTTGTCPSAQLIDTFEGNGNQTTDTFDTTTDSFRITYEASDTDETTPGFLGITVNNAEGLPVGTASQEGAGTGETFVNEPPGTYSLDISAVFTDYVVTVEQCEGGDPSQNPGDPVDPVEPPPVIQERDDELFVSGGPEVGPVPVMPDGACPPEFPVEREGACWHRV